jgi:hypothetical protein
MPSNSRLTFAPVRRVPVSARGRRSPKGIAVQAHGSPVDGQDVETRERLRRDELQVVGGDRADPRALARVDGG